MNLSKLRDVIRKTSLPELLKRDLKITNIRKLNEIRKDVDVDEKIDKSNGDNSDNEELVEPTTCCMSGCVNCVWIQYAEKLSKSLANSNEDDVKKIIMEKVRDENMRAFLNMELRCRKLIR